MGRRTRRLLLVIVIAGLAVGAGMVWFTTQERAAPQAPATVSAGSPGPGEVIFACPGRIEGMNEPVQIGAAASGLLEGMPFAEGDTVSRGQIVARIQCSPLEAERAIAMAQLDASVASHQRLLRGSRPEERLEAEANTAAADAALTRARLRYERVEGLFQGGVMPPDERDQALRDFQLAEQQHAAALQRQNLINAGALPEEIEKSEAEIRAAEQRVDLLQRQLDQCIVKAPTAGTVLRVYKHVGEAYSTVFPEPILSIADTSRFRVRAEVDEHDINRVFIGQKAEITADALDGQTLGGRVESIGAQMGRKKTRTGDPAERADRDVLEVMITLDETTLRLLPDLRVTVRFFPAEGRK